MRLLGITTRQIANVGLIFVGVIAGFGLVGWPNEKGWAVVVIVALVLGLLPILSPLITFLQESGAVVDFRGIKKVILQRPRMQVIMRI